MNKNGNRVLVVSERPALPAHDGARRRLVSLLRALDGYEVDYIHFKQPGENFRPIEGELSHCRTMAVVEHDNRQSMTGRVRSIISSKTYGVIRNRSKQMVRVLQRIPRDRCAMTVLCGLSMAQYRPAIPIDHALLDLCDSELRHFSMRYRFLRDPMKKAYCAWEHWKTRSELEKSARSFDGWLVISEAEADSLRAYFPKVPTSIVGNSLPHWEMRRVVSPRENLIVLAGNFEYYPNVDAAVYFAGEIMPLLRRARERCRLRIIGSNPPQAVRRLVAADIEVTGFVEDFPAAVSEGAVFVCPLRLGTGIKNKVLEAMDFGVPVVSTLVGVEGITALPGTHYLQAVNAADFAHCVSCLLRDSALRAELARNANRLVRARFSNDAVREQLRAALGRLGFVANSI